MSSPTLLILAAGIGSRYGAAKLFESISPGNETIMDYSIYDAHRAGFRRIVFVIRIDMEHTFKAAIQAHFGLRREIEYAFQRLARLPAGFHVPPGRIRPWGTTHAILSAQGIINEPFAVINVDDFYGAESYRAMAQHLQSGTSDHAMAGFVLRNTLPEFGPVARGICQVSPQGFLEKIVELKNVERDDGHAISTDIEGRETALIGNEIACMNMWGFTPAIFDSLECRFRCFLEQNGSDLLAESYIPVAINELLMEGLVRVKVLRCADPWFGITYQDDHTLAVARVRRLVEAGLYPRKLTI